MVNTVQFKVCLIGLDDDGTGLDWKETLECFLESISCLLFLVC